MQCGNLGFNSHTLAHKEIIEKKLAASEPLDGIEELLSGGKGSHGPDAYLQELTKKIREDVVEEVEEKFNRKLSNELAKVKKVQDNVTQEYRWS
ncbi:hypothetical protein AgCh_027083 [Apium graveolens]